MATLMTEEEIADQEQDDPTQARQITVTLAVSEVALRRVRAGFNPDRLTDVGKIHQLGAALITLLESHFRPVPPLPTDPNQYDEHVHARHHRETLMANEQNRHVAMAISDIENGTMYGVKAATTQMYWDKNVR